MSAPRAQDRDRDALLGMAWWNDLTRAERAVWLQRAGSAVPADAWATFKRTAGEPQGAQEVTEKPTV